MTDAPDVDTTDNAPAAPAKSKIGFETILGVAGALVALGFFLPWIELPMSIESVSGLDVMRAGGNWTGIVAIPVFGLITAVLGGLRWNLSRYTGLLTAIAMIVPAAYLLVLHMPLLYWLPFAAGVTLIVLGKLSRGLVVALPLGGALLLASVIIPFVLRDSPLFDLSEQQVQKQVQQQNNDPKTNKTPGDKTQGDKTQGDKTQGDKTQGDKTQGDKTQGDKTQGDKTPEDKTQGDTAQGDTAQGDKTPEDKTQGDKTPEDKTQGDTTQGDTTQGDTTQGDTATGQQSGASPTTAKERGPANPFGITMLDGLGIALAIPFTALALLMPFCGIWLLWTGIRKKNQQRPLIFTGWALIALDAYAAALAVFGPILQTAGVGLWMTVIGGGVLLLMSAPLRTRRKNKQAKGQEKKQAKADKKAARKQAKADDKAAAKQAKADEKAAAKSKAQDNAAPANRDADGDDKAAKTTAKADDDAAAKADDAAAAKADDAAAAKADKLAKLKALKARKQAEEQAKQLAAEEREADKLAAENARAGAALVDEPEPQFVSDPTAPAAPDDESRDALMQRMGVKKPPPLSDNQLDDMLAALKQRAGDDE